MRRKPLSFWTTIFLTGTMIAFLFNGSVALAYTPLVCLDPGHGGQDPGATSSTGFQEKEANLDIGLRVRNLLQSVGMRTIMTREADTFPSLGERANLANNVQADIFISIHNNFAVSPDGSQNSGARGTETYYYYNSTRGNLLAALIQEEVTKQANTVNRGVKTANFYVLANTKMSAVLVEGVFLSNSEEEAMLKDPAFRQRLAEGITQGIIRYFEQTSEYRVFYPLPQYFRIHVPSVTSNTRIQVSTYFTSTKWVSQPILAPGDYLIRVDPDGFVRSLDSKLAFTKSLDGTNPGLSVYIHNPDNRNAADFVSYLWTNSTIPQGAILWSSSGFIDFDSGAVASSTSGNSVSLTSARETIYPQDLMLQVHLDSITPYTYLEIPFYWKRVIYRSQRPLPPGDYWIQVKPDPNPGDPASAPYLLSLDGKIRFIRTVSSRNPDPVFAVYIAQPNRPEVGFDVVGFVRNFRRPNTYQTILGAKPTGPDSGLGFVSSTGIADPARATTNYPTIPTQTLSGGNFVVVTDAGLIRGRVMARSVATPLIGAKVTINGISMFTDANGEFSFTHLVPGVYVLEYSAPGYITQTQVVPVAGGAPTYTPWAIMSP